MLLVNISHEHNASIIFLNSTHWTLPVFAGAAVAAGRWGIGWVSQIPSQDMQLGIRISHLKSAEVVMAYALEQIAEAWREASALLLLLLLLLLMNFWECWYLDFWVSYLIFKLILWICENMNYYESWLPARWADGIVFFLRQAASKRLVKDLEVRDELRSTPLGLWQLYIYIFEKHLPDFFF